VTTPHVPGDPRRAPRAASRRRGGPEGGALVHCFPPIARPDARVLVLGTMPSPASLQARQYYAHPRNAFWPIVAALCGFDPAARYDARAAALAACGVAVWDVLAACVRPGSLDADIDDASAVTNDFAGFFATHRRIRRVCFNGAKAETLYVRRVLPALDPAPIVEYVRLPSTSPAHAGRSLAAKLEAWRVLLAPASGRSPAPLQ
jgi:double-stranded uracil-DNA glycosylase